MTPVALLGGIPSGVGDVLSVTLAVVVFALLLVLVEGLRRI